MSNIMNYSKYAEEIYLVPFIINNSIFNISVFGHICRIYDYNTNILLFEYGTEYYMKRYKTSFLLCNPYNKKFCIVTKQELEDLCIKPDKLEFTHNIYVDNKNVDMSNIWMTKEEDYMTDTYKMNKIVGAKILTKETYILRLGKSMNKILDIDENRLSCVEFYKDPKYIIDSIKTRNIRFIFPLIK
jgi:hypothetical protein